MARIKTKKKEQLEQVKESGFYFYIIIFLLAIQTVFLFYKNYGFIKEQFQSDPNAGYENELSGSETGTGDNDTGMVDPSVIRVSVLNGCGEPGLASTWKDRLRNMKYDVRETGNASGKYNKTVILSRIEDMSYARHLARSLGVKNDNVLMQINKDLVDIDVTVIVGSDYKNLGN